MGGQDRTPQYCAGQPKPALSPGFLEYRINMERINFKNSSSGSFAKTLITFLLFRFHYRFQNERLEPYCVSYFMGMRDI